MGENVANLTDGHNVSAGRSRDVEERPCRRRDRIVAAVGGAAELCVCAYERPRDDAADVEWIDQLARSFADAIQAIEAERLLVRRDLEHAVGGRVADRSARADVLVAEFRNDLRSAGMAIAEDAG